MLRRACLLVAVLLTAPALVAQPVQETAPLKDPGRAQLLSFVVPGGGQFYNGEALKGAVILGGAVGGVAVAATALPKLAEDVLDRGYYTTHGTTLGVGLGVAGVLWLYGVIDAPNGARRANARAQLSAVPLPDGGAVAFRVRF